VADRCRHLVARACLQSDKAVTGSKLW